MTKTCTNCGTVNGDNASFCQNCGNKFNKSENLNEWVKKVKEQEKSSPYNDLNKWLKIGGLLFILFILLVVVNAALSFNNQNTSDTISTPTNTAPTPVENESQFKESCQSISYSLFDKNPDKYKGQRVKFTGEIVQIMEDSYGTFIRLDVGSYDMVAVFYDGTTPDSLVEGTYITVWGTGTGSYTYTSQANYQITIPSMNAKYFEVTGGT